MTAPIGHGWQLLRPETRRTRLKFNPTRKKAPGVYAGTRWKKWRSKEVVLARG